MTAPVRHLTVDQALGEFQALLRERMGDDAAADVAAAGTPAEDEESRFACAELILKAACPDPRACTDQQCRRGMLCRHFMRLRAKRESGVASHPRRTPGAEAVRYAIWVYMSSRR
jgi:hypothetical protein